MTLRDGIIGNTYEIEQVALSVELEKRLEALGMIRGTRVQVLNSKSHGTLVIKMRGTRFAIGKGISGKITVKEMA